MPDLRAKIIEAIDNSIDNFVPASELEEAADMVSAVLQAQEPVAWEYTINEEWLGYSHAKPPEDAYDKGSLQARYSAPIPPTELVVPEVTEEMIDRASERQSKALLAGLTSRKAIERALEAALVAAAKNQGGE